MNGRSGRLARLGARFRRRSFRLSVSLLAAVLLLVIPWIYIKLLTPAPIPVELPELDAGERYRVYVAVWHYHSSLILEQPRGWRLGPAEREEARFVEYGWGDRSFFLEGNYWPHRLFATVLLPTESVLYLRAFDAPPELLFPGVEMYVRELSGPELRRLATTVEQQMALSPAGGRPEAVASAFGYEGLYYAGREYYIFWQNCNAWTVRMLRDAGLGADPRLVILSGQVASGLDGFRPVGEP